MGTARKVLIEAGRFACRQQLEAMGFKRHEADIFTLPLAPRLFGWVGLGRGVHRGDGSMDIMPWVGLLHQDVERLVAACAHLPYHRSYPSTLQTNMGQLTPDATDLWVVFHPHQPVDEPAKRVCRPINVYGIPWMRKHASLAAIYALVTSSQFTVPLHSFKPPVIAWMLGHQDLARQHMRDHLARITADAGPNAAGALEVYKRFATELDERMARGPWVSPARK